MAQDTTSSQVQDLVRRLQLLEDKEQIREVLYRNARGVDRADPALLKETYHPDGYEVHWETFTGNGHEFSDFITTETATARSVYHSVTNPLIDIQDHRAFSETAYTARTLVDRTPELGGWVEVVVWGRCLDVLEKRDGVWRIAYRQLARDGAKRTIVPDPLVPPALTCGRPDRTDPSYLGMAIAERRPPQQAGKDGMFVAQRHLP
ncbi:nuclear transport factor 2 family protein [Streptomyces sp. NPDC001982]|uniref:nuclear transport factor 2 family protein n=1 Tax=Streptomyces sp. NPDC001982 TaxID=3154405 RepID=UPI003324CF03